MSQKERFLCLDSIKGFAIIMIILVHSIQNIDGISRAFNVFWFGQMGCQIFFVVSGFLIAKSWKNVEIGKQSKKEFYKRRFLTIAPGYYFIILLTHFMNGVLNLLCGLDIGFAKNNNIFAVICNLLFLNGLLPFCNNNVAPGGWYIGTTAVFYALLPVIYFVLKKVKKCSWTIPLLFNVLAVCIVLLAIRILGHERFFLTNNGFVYFSFLIQLPCFLLGVQLNSEKCIEQMRDVVLCFVVSILLIGCSMVLFFGNISKYNFLIIPTIFSYGIYYFIKCLFWFENKYEIKETLLSKFGKKSYYMYLSHGFFAWSMMSFVQLVLDKIRISYNPTLVYLILLPIVFIFSWLFACVIEKICGFILSVLNHKK